MKKTYILLAAVLVFAFIMNSCDRRKITRTDTTTSGFAQIMADETYAPIVREQLDVFMGINQGAFIEPVFLGEQDVFQLLTSDSIRMAVTARNLTPEERAVIESHRRTIRSQRIALDGIALIVNRGNPDSLITMDMLRRVMTGEVTDWNVLYGKTGHDVESKPITVVFDKPNSSTVRFMIDSVINGQVLCENLFTAQSNSEVIDFVSRTPNALGVIGVNWVSNPRDSLKLSFNDTIRVLRISREEVATTSNSFPPYPAYIATRNYPLVRESFAILTDVRGGLPAGFTAFIAGEAGQRIILKAGLVPATAPTRLLNVITD